MDDINRGAFRSAILDEAADLDLIASLQHPDLDETDVTVQLLYGDERNSDATTMLLLRYARAAMAVKDASDLTGEDVPEDLIARWAEKVAILVVRWERGDPLAMAPFRGIALDILRGADA